MTQGQLKALRKLREKGSKGVTWDDYPRGFAIRSRISELRLNHDIKTIIEDIGKGVKRARYILIKEGTGA